MGDTKPTTIYDETAQQIESAFLAFKSLYMVQTPPPVAQSENRGVFGAKHVGLAGALVGSIIVSASHTIPVFLGMQSITDVRFSIELVIAIAAFAMIEIGIVTFAYSATESAIHRDELHRVRRFTNAGKWFIAFIMLVANVFYVLQINVIPVDAGGVWSGVRVLIYLSIGASAPVIAFITGDILAIDVLKHRSRQTKADEQHAAAMAEYNAALLDAWNRQKAKWGGVVDIRVSKPPVQQDNRTDNLLPVQAQQSNWTDTGQSSGHGYQYVSNASDKVRAYLLQFPQDATMNVRELADKIGVGKSTVSSVRADMKKRGEL